MTALQQIPQIDAAVAALDKRINSTLSRKNKLLDSRTELDRKINNMDAYLKRLGTERSKIATFELPALFEEAT